MTDDAKKYYEQELDLLGENIVRIITRKEPKTAGAWGTVFELSKRACVISEHLALDAMEIEVTDEDVIVPNDLDKI